MPALVLITPSGWITLAVLRLQADDRLLLRCSRGDSAGDPPHGAGNLAAEVD